MPSKRSFVQAMLDVKSNNPDTKKSSMEGADMEEDRTGLRGNRDLPGLIANQFSDLTIICSYGGKFNWYGGELEGRPDLDPPYEVHKIIVCTQSEYLARKCEEMSQYFNKTVIDLGDDDHVVVKAALDFMYEGTYTDDVFIDLDEHGLHEDLDFDVPAPLAFHVEVVFIAAKYMIPGLQAKALSELQRQLETNYGDDRKDIADLVHAIHVIYNKQGYGPEREKLKKVILETAHRFINRLLNFNEIRDLLKEEDGLAYDLLKGTAKEKIKEAKVATLAYQRAGPARKRIRRSEE
ncbi:hypothetical protein K490DRAFT_66616 [Saccharata proteae CBS 121410]|uniref:BTB domain-containing protein n=1 Tax=Saccharata proteae CBS 121410 TaxID=1314787 RepID=A0A9P4HVI9_9PEZI|nr:hypothetical protein K490DRAFT_66616 [Saccharata proteae CBS 121410]